MRALIEIASRRFHTTASVVGDVQARVVTVFFYFTILVPFGLASTLLSDPLRRKKPGQAGWLEREPVPTDINSAKQQG